MNNPHFLLTSDHLLTICSSVNWEDKQIQALLSTTPNNLLSLHQFRSVKPFLECKNERKGYFCSIITRAFTMVTDLWRFVHLVVFYLINNAELNSLLPSNKAYVNSFVWRGTRASDCRLVSTGSPWASAGTAPMAGTRWLRNTCTTPSRNLSEASWRYHLLPTSHWLSFHLSHSSKDTMGMQTLIPVSR